MHLLHLVAMNALQAQQHCHTSQHVLLLVVKGLVAVAGPFQICLQVEGQCLYSFCAS